MFGSSSFQNTLFNVITIMFIVIKVQNSNPRYGMEAFNIDLLFVSEPDAHLTIDIQDYLQFKKYWRKEELKTNDRNYIINWAMNQSFT